MYRAVAWKSRELGIDLGEQERIAKVAQSIQIEFVPGEDKQEIVVDGKIVTSALRQEDRGKRANCGEGDLKCADTDFVFTHDLSVM